MTSSPQPPQDPLAPQAPQRLTVACEGQGASGGNPVAIEFTFSPPEAPAAEPRAPRRLLNLALAIDRSGSMDGDKLRAARQAAIGLVDGLADGERLAAVAFDNEVTTIAESTPLTGALRDALRSRFLAIESGGTTALFDGFLRAAALAGNAGNAAECDSWTIVLSDGMGNQGVTEPKPMRMQASAIAELGVRTIAIGIGSDYRAEQLTALADGGGGEFHHASAPGEIVEIVLGELRALRHVAARDLRMQLTVQGAGRWLLLGGTAQQEGESGETRFDRASSGRPVRVSALVWPERGGASVTCNARWVDAAQHAAFEGAGTALAQGPVQRDVPLAMRAARLWHAHIMAEALERNERHDYEAAVAWVRAAADGFHRYVAGLPEMHDLLESLHELERRVGHRWESRSHREAFVMARKGLKGVFDLRNEAPLSFGQALSSDDGE